MFSGLKALMLTHDYYDRMLDVCMTLSCVMCWYVYRARLDVGRGTMTVLYVIVFVIIACVSMIMCLYVYYEYRAGPDVRRCLTYDESIIRAGIDVGRGLSPSET